MTTVQDLEDFIDAIGNWQHDQKVWAEDQIDRLNNSLSIGSNPHTPPPPPPGTEYENA